MAETFLMLVIQRHSRPPLRRRPFAGTLFSEKSNRSPASKPQDSRLRLTSYYRPADEDALLSRGHPQRRPRRRRSLLHQPPNREEDIRRMQIRPIDSPQTPNPNRRTRFVDGFEVSRRVAEDFRDEESEAA